jgi:hypothetical protein
MYYIKAGTSKTRRTNSVICCRILSQPSSFIHYDYAGNSSYTTNIAVPSTFSYPGLGPAMAVLNSKKIKNKIRKNKIGEYN